MADTRIGYIEITFEHAPDVGQRVLVNCEARFDKDAYCDPNNQIYQSEGDMDTLENALAEVRRIAICAGIV